MRRQRTCIFCGGKGAISKEHFWPQWAGQYLTKTSETHNISELHAAEGKAPKQLKSLIKRQGNVVTKKIRVVCRDCNHGWMGSLEERVKPTIVNLLQGHNYKLNMDQIDSLSLWASVKTIVAEHAESHMALTPSADRYLVYKNGSIPEYFRIFMGFHSSETTAAYIRHSATISLSMSGPDPALSPDIRRNIQTVSFLVGPLLFHVMATRVASFNLDEVFVFSSSALAKLWPSSQKEIDLSLLKRIDNAGLSTIANSLDKLVSLPTVKYGGPLPTSTSSN